MAVVITTPACIAGALIRLVTCNNQRTLGPSDRSLTPSDYSSPSSSTLNSHLIAAETPTGADLAPYDSLLVHPPFLLERHILRW